MIINGQMGLRLGLQYLFLDPEYLNEVNFWSFLFIGLAYGGFLMSWNLTTYLLSAHRFPFLATLSRPLTKFSLNNIIIPLSFFIFYLVKIISFQSLEQSNSGEQIFLSTLGIIFGTFTIVLLYSLYFHFTNRDINYYRKNKDENGISPGFANLELDPVKLDNNRWKVKTFLNESFQRRYVRSVAHYDPELIKNIFKQNHLNALIIQLFSMFLLVIIGNLAEFPMFRIPAGASIFILLSLITALIGALTYWFREWRWTVIIVIVLMLNSFISSEKINYPNQAYGLNYEASTITYNYEALKELFTPENIRADIKQTEEILNQWKAKNTSDLIQKPKLVVISVSGGGLKSALWSLNVLQTLDKKTSGQLSNHTMLITGASGGLIGAAYYRELLYRKTQNPHLDIYKPEYLDTISKDLLNSVAFSIVSKDLFIPVTTFKYKGKSYYKDRGYAFEVQLNENTNNLLMKTISDYCQPEKSAKIPMMLISPSIVNDARQLLISPHQISYMMAPLYTDEYPNDLEIDAVDFNRLFKDHDASQLSFISALRMNATFPYVLPNVQLPTSPRIEAMDAGLLDNYGVKTATRFIRVFKDWILENTSGVIFLQIASSEKFKSVRPIRQEGMIEALFNPLGILGQIFTVQEFDHDNNLGFLYDLLGPDHFDLIRFIYEPVDPESPRASISFHLTNKERADILGSINIEQNQQNLEKIKATLNSVKPVQVNESAETSNN